MSSLSLIDTSAWIFALGANPVHKVKERVEYLVEQNLAAITSPIIFELLSAGHTENDVARLKIFLSTLHPYPFLSEEWVEAAGWASSLRRKGSKIKTVDALIAFKAIKHNLVLLHADADIDRLAKICPLKVESHVTAVRQAPK